MLDHLPRLAHGLRVQIEPALHRLRYILVLPAVIRRCGPVQ
jgi:hypothetical protein